MNKARNTVDPVDILSRARALDESLSLTSSSQPKWIKKQLHSTAYSKKKWFQNIVDGDISLFHRYPVPSSKEGTSADSIPSTINAIKSWRPRGQIRVQTGPSRTKKYLSFQNIMDRWENEKAVVSATDIHVRRTKLEKIFDIDLLTHVNLLPSAGIAAKDLEMLTMVVSSKNNVTDSHSDDLDGSNYCFCGLKLWLAWDYLEGQQKGLEDCDRDYTGERAHFDMAAFLSLKSARWFCVGEGDMLFLPGNYTHKVITLEKYIGVGGFYVCLLNAVRTLARWELRGANWELTDDGIDPHSARSEIVKTMRRALTKKSRKELNAHGISHIPSTLKLPKSDVKKLHNAESSTTLELIDSFETFQNSRRTAEYAAL
jgi:hypothetical protein